jgi:hypothetical protein
MPVILSACGFAHRDSFRHTVKLDGLTATMTATRPAISTHGSLEQPSIQSIASQFGGPSQGRSPSL